MLPRRNQHGQQHIVRLGQVCLPDHVHANPDSFVGSPRSGIPCDKHGFVFASSEGDEPIIGCATCDAEGCKQSVSLTSHFRRQAHVLLEVHIDELDRVLWAYTRISGQTG